MLVIRYDVDDWATGFIPQWVAGLAAHVDSVDVLALYVGNIGHPPPNVTVASMGKERGARRPGLLMRFYWHTLRSVPRCDAVFVHMIPRYALLVAPLVRLWHKPMVLWYTHREPSDDLRRAMHFVSTVITADATSFPLAHTTPRPTVLGHGIDTDIYTPNDTPPEPATVVHVARLQPIKNQHVLLGAVAHLPDAHAVIIGDVPDGEDRAYADRLRQQAAPLAGRVQFTGGVPSADVRRAYRRAWVAVNLSPPGLFDKAALESMACGVPTLVSNPAFRPVLGDAADLLLLPPDVDAATLAARLQTLFAIPPHQHRALGQHLRERVRELHSLHALMPRIAQMLRQAQAR